MDADRPVVWSYGGGTQSVAIAVLIAQGRLPRPDHIVIADTSRETRVTWEYTDAHVRDLVAPTPIVVLDHIESRVDVWAGDNLLIPAFTTRNGRVGKLPTYCSGEWKRDPVRRWMRRQGYGPKKPVDVWLGISVDELHRAKASKVGWFDYRYPLLFDVPMTRADCVELVRSAGLPTPPRSACWMCPHRTDAQWRELRDERPDEWALAIDFEEGIRLRNPDVYLHRGGKPLAVVDIDATEGGGLWDQDGCATGFCFT